MLKVGLTGNIGSGKTVVAGIFEKLGVPVFNADLAARKLFDQEEIRQKISNIFGEQVFSETGEINRQVLAEIVFNSPLLLDKLNKIIHPAVRADYQSWCLEHPGFPYTIYEAAILFESGHYTEMDKVICVTAPEEIRIRRVIERDWVTAQEVKRRMKNQWEEEKKVKLADFVIRNDETRMLIEQVLEIHKLLVGQLDN